MNFNVFIRNIFYFFSMVAAFVLPIFVLIDIPNKSLLFWTAMASLPITFYMAYVMVKP